MKTATEILQELKDQVLFLVSIANVNEQKINYIISLLLKDKDHGETGIINQDILDKNNPTSKVVLAKGNEALSLKAKHAEQQNKNSVFEKMAEEYGVDDQDDLEDSESKAQFNTKRGNMSNAIPVSQVLLDENSKPVALATVKITDNNGKVVKTVRSNVSGKWVSALKPGEYEIHALRKFVSDSSKKPLELKYKITVKSGISKLELEPKTL